MNAGRRLPSVFEAEPQLHVSIFDEVVPLSDCPRADAGAPIYDERHCIRNVGQQMIARDGRRELRSGAAALFQPQTAAQAKEVHLHQYPHERQLRAPGTTFGSRRPVPRGAPEAGLAKLAGKAEARI